MLDMVSAKNRFGKYLAILVMLISFAGAVSAASGTGTIIAAMSGLCLTARTLLSVGSMLLIVVAAAVYAVGQIVGAETRARASVWATAMITGAIIGIIIYLVVPQLIQTMMGTASCQLQC
jgi:hypothetical protein